MIRTGCSFVLLKPTATMEGTHRPPTSHLIPVIRGCAPSTTSHPIGFRKHPVQQGLGAERILLPAYPTRRKEAYITQLAPPSFSNHRMVAYIGLTRTGTPSSIGPGWPSIPAVTCPKSRPICLKTESPKGSPNSPSLPWKPAPP